jgi:hypothetical protein
MDDVTTASQMTFDPDQQQKQQVCCSSPFLYTFSPEGCSGWLTGGPLHEASDLTQPARLPGFSFSAACLFITTKHCSD